MKHKPTGSSLWRYFNCPGCFNSTWDNRPTYATRRGHRIHKMIEYYLKGLVFTDPCTYEDKDDFNKWKAWWIRFKPMNVKEILGIELCYGYDLVTRTYKSFDVVDRQYPETDTIIFGTGDLIYRDFHNHVVYLDWKTGEYYPDYDIQFSFMSQAALEVHGGKDRLCAFYSVSNHKIEFLTDDRIYDIRHAFDNKLPENTFRIGKWCSFCPAQDCPKDKRFKVVF